MSGINLRAVLIAGALLGFGAALPVGQVQASSKYPTIKYPTTKYTNGKYGVETTASIKARFAWHKKHDGKWLHPWFFMTNSKSGINWLKDSRQKIVYQAVAGHKVLFSVSEVYQRGQKTNEYYYRVQKLPSKWHSFYLVTAKDIKTPFNWKNKKGVTYVKVRYATKKKGAIAKTKTLKSSEPFPNDPYPKTKYSNGKYGVETDASLRAKIAWHKRHYGKSSDGWYRKGMTVKDLAMYRKSRQKIVHIAVKGYSHKILFKATDVQEGRFGDYIWRGKQDGYGYRCFDPQKLPAVYKKHYFLTPASYHIIRVDWTNKTGIVYCRVPYFTKRQFK